MQIATQSAATKTTRNQPIVRKKSSDYARCAHGAQASNLKTGMLGDKSLREA